MAVNNLVPGQIKMNVHMKDGREFLGCEPPGESEMVVGFRYEGALRMVSLQDILHVDFYNDSSGDSTHDDR